ncbi:DNA polymerase III subunit chi [Candidatus Providencia siddallii]|uniref:DNA polymerase III subunit chi n=1 Tax=Candidatus Providencia siddallii TaxID=1715285 RepID=A0A0M6W8F2_9GAMM|nr:DNA polymerase III subunit chi [Candidatus Providencia siddallii]
MKKGIFYLLKETILNKKINEHELLTCKLSIQLWNKKRILIACDTEQQAKKIDEFLWKLYPNRFIPHNLSSEKYCNKIPIEICWPEKKSNTQRDMLINLQNKYLDSITSFHEIIDFVPINNNLKKLARERFLFYRKAGFNLTVLQY